MLKEILFLMNNTKVKEIPIWKQWEIVHKATSYSFMAHIAQNPQQIFFCLKFPAKNDSQYFLALLEIEYFTDTVD